MDSDLKNKTANAANITAFLITRLLAANVVLRFIPITPDFILIKKEKCNELSKRPTEKTAPETVFPRCTETIWRRFITGKQKRLQVNQEPASAKSHSVCA